MRPSGLPATSRFPLPSLARQATLTRPGVLSGEGIGPEVVACALDVLGADEDSIDVSFVISHGGLIGRDAESQGETVLPDGVIEFCRNIFAKNGAILSGPGGGRYVYDLRREFGLFCKFSPIRPCPKSRDSNRLKPEIIGPKSDC